MSEDEVRTMNQMMNEEIDTRAVDIANYLTAAAGKKDSGWTPNEDPLVEAAALITFAASVLGSTIQTMVPGDQKAAANILKTLGMSMASAFLMGRMVAGFKPPATPKIIGASDEPQKLIIPQRNYREH